jgi:flagellar hook protein FlgE
MSIMNLGKFTQTLANMKIAAEAKGGNGWHLPHAQPGSQKTSAVVAMQPTILTSGDGVMRTVDLAQEVVYEALSGHALTGVNNLWFDGEVHRPINSNLTLVHDILLAAVKVISGSSSYNLTDYLLHVNDVDANSSMARTRGQNFSYFASQMAVIDQSGNAHFLSMDRVRSKVAALTTNYTWRALVIGDSHELSITHAAPNGLIDIEPATGYVQVSDLKIAIFTRRFSALAKQANSVTEYAYRGIPAKPAPTATMHPIRSGLRDRASAAFHDPIKS